MSSSVTAIICPFLTLGQQLEPEMRGPDLQLLVSHCFLSPPTFSSPSQHQKTFAKTFSSIFSNQPTRTKILISEVILRAGGRMRGLCLLGWSVSASFGDVKSTTWLLLNSQLILTQSPGWTQPPNCSRDWRTTPQSLWLRRKG